MKLIFLVIISVLSSHAYAWGSQWPYETTWERKTDLFASLVPAVIKAESSGNPSAVSPKGAVGLMQLMPETGLRFGVKPEERTDPKKNVAGGTAYLKWLHQYYKGDVKKTIAAYNCGEGCVDQGMDKLPSETRTYLKRVLTFMGVHDA